MIFYYFLCFFIKKLFLPFTIDSTHSDFQSFNIELSLKMDRLQENHHHHNSAIDKLQHELEMHELHHLGEHFHVTDAQLREHPQDIYDRAEKLSYFHVDPPKSIIQGITMSEYNIAKGFIAGTAMIVSAPWISAIEEMELADDVRSDSFYIISRMF